MKLLLVDDERYVIESIKKNICWERTGITEIYTAFTMKQAQEIITAVKMDIIISDIVMPAATGFDLVQWVRKQNFRIQVIFLTSYAAVLQEKQIEKLTEASEQWEKDRTILQKDIWRNLLSGNMTQNQFCESAKRMDLYQDGLIYFKLICFYMDHKAEETQKWEPSTIEFIMQNVLTELFHSFYARVDTVFCENELLDHFVQWMTDHVHSYFWCGAGNWSGFSEVTAQADDLRKMRESSLSVWNEVIYLYEFQPSGTVYKNAELDTWKTLLAGEEVEADDHAAVFAVIKDGRYTDGVCMAVRDGDLCQCTFFR